MVSMFPARPGALYIIHPKPDIDVDWNQAACKDRWLRDDVDLFYPDPDQDNVIRQAKQICKGTDGGRNQPIPPCPILNECLRYALETRDFNGVWGGTTGRERHKALQQAARRRSQGAA